MKDITIKYSFKYNISMMSWISHLAQQRAILLLCAMSDLDTQRQKCYLVYNAFDHCHCHCVFVACYQETLKVTPIP